MLKVTINVYPLTCILTKVIKVGYINIHPNNHYIYLYNMKIKSIHIGHTNKICITPFNLLCYIKFDQKQNVGTYLR